MVKYDFPIVPPGCSHLHGNADPNEANDDRGIRPCKPRVSTFRSRNSKRYVQSIRPHEKVARTCWGCYCSIDWYLSFKYGGLVNAANSLLALVSFCIKRPKKSHADCTKTPGCKSDEHNRASAQAGPRQFARFVIMHLMV
jgi:hypothetical protein